VIVVLVYFRMDGALGVIGRPHEQPAYIAESHSPALETKQDLRIELGTTTSVYPPSSTPNCVGVVVIISWLILVYARVVELATMRCSKLFMEVMNRIPMMRLR
jgi:hypothetical protein